MSHLTRCLLFAALSLSFLTGDLRADNWPSFRGSQASGVQEGADPPVSWNVETGENILWTAETEGLGLSSPIIWGERVFLTTAVSQEPEIPLKVGAYGSIAPVESASVHKWKVLCFDKNTGKLIWERVAHEGRPAVKRHPKSSHANATLATDGERLIALFGSEGLYCYDLDGELLWKRDLGLLDAGFFQVPEAQWEYGASPVIHDGRVIVQADVQQGSFLAAIDLEDGGDVWRSERNDVPTWSSPAVYEADGETRILVNGWKHAGAYDFKTGEELWKKSDAGGDIPVPTPIFWNDLAFLTSSHGGRSPVYAIRLGAGGEVVWESPKGGSYMATPLIYDDLLYVADWIGVLRCFRPDTGEMLYAKRLAGSGEAVTASPVGASGKIYIISESGEVFVVQAGPEFELLATNSMGEPALASPALSDGTLYVRTETKLVAIKADAR